MGIFDRKKAATSSPAPEAPAQTQTAQSTATAANPVASAQNPPWAQAGCQACKGKGVSSKGLPCRACDVVAERTGGITSTRFTSWTDSDGVFRWAEAKKVEPAPTPKTVEDASPKEIAAVIDSTIDETAPPAKKRRGRPTKAEVEAREAALKTDVATITVDEKPVVLNTYSIEITEKPTDGFKLYIDCIPTDGKFVDLGLLISQEGVAMAAAASKDSYFEIDAFKRRDMLASNVVAIVESLKGADVVCIDASPDVRAFLSVLRPYADRVFVATK